MKTFWDVYYWLTFWVNECDSSEYNKYDQLGFSRSNCTKYLSSEQKKYLLTDD